MKRQKRVLPDAVIETPDGPISHVSRDALREEAALIADLLDFAGGGVTIETKRYPSGHPYESITLAAVWQWRSHGQNTSKDQPEDHEPLADPTPEQLEARLEREEEAEQQAAAREPGEIIGVPTEFEKEDNSALPEELRA